MSLLDYSVSQALLASRIVGKRNSYAADNPTESQAVLGYLKGGPRPSSVATAMGNHLVALEDARRAPVTPPPPTGTPTMKKPYKGDSWSNMPVDPNNPNIMSRSQAVVNWMVNVAPLGYHFALGGHGCPTYYADANTPRVTVQQNLGSYASKMWTNIPIDPSWRPGTDPAEPDMCIFDTDGTEYAFYKVTAPGVTPMDGYGAANQYWQSVGIYKTAGTGEPGGWQGTGGGGSGGANTFHDGGENAGAAKVKNWEILNCPVGGDWGHALSCSAPRVCNGFVYPSGFVSSSVTYPVSELTAVPSGTRYWLPPTYDIENAICDWPNDTFGGSGNWFGKPLLEVDKQLLRTFAKYGCYINDQNGSAQWPPGTGNDNSVGIGTEGNLIAQIRGDATIAWEHGVMAPWYPRLPRSAVKALKITSFRPQTTY